MFNFGENAHNSNCTAVVGQTSLFLCSNFNYMNESDLRSDVHYLGSSENKAWKKFRPVRDLNP